MRTLAAEVIRIMLSGALAFGAALLMTPIWVKFLERRRMAKHIRPATHAPVFNKFHEKKAGVLTGGGIIVWSTVAGMAALFWVLGHLFDGFWANLDFIDRRETYLPLAALLIGATLGMIDDLAGVLRIGPNGGGLKVRHKLIVYTLIAAIGAWWFYYKLEWTTLSIPFLGYVEMGWWYIPFFMFIIVATSFSANETDGLDGLLGGVSLFAFFALTTVAFTQGRYDLAAFGSVMVGSLLAFLWFNIYPARFFMGDTGSISIGVSLATIALLTNTALLLPFFGIILVVESLSVLVQAASKRFLGKKLFLSSPLHHHFEALGWPESQITMRFWIISAIFSALGLVIFFLARLM